MPGRDFVRRLVVAGIFAASALALGCVDVLGLDDDTFAASPSPLPKDTTHAYRKAVIADEPVSYWRLDDDGSTARDSMAGHHDGKYWNVIQGVPGAIGDDDAGCRFDGGYVDMGVSPLLDVEDFSVEVWIRPDPEPSKARRIASKLPAPGREMGGWSLYLDPELDGSGPTVVFETTESSASAISNWVVLGPEPPMEVYSHVVLTYRKGDTPSLAELYLNGTLMGASGAQLTPDASARLFLGGAVGEPGTWRGDLDDVSVYNRALSQETIAAHYATGMARP